MINIFYAVFFYAGMYYIFSRQDKISLILKFSFYPLMGAAVVLLIYYVFLIFWYAYSYFFLDHVEPNMAVVANFLLKGLPVYHAGNVPDRYGFPYGPMVYLFNAFFLHVFQPSIFSSKIGGVMAGFTSLLLVVFFLGKTFSKSVVLLILGCVVWVYLQFGNITFWNRPDSYILCFVALGLWMTECTNKTFVIAGLGVVLGIIFNLKVHAILFLWPAYFIVYSKYGAKATLISCIIAIFVVVIPFLIGESFNFKDYLACFIFSEFSLRHILINAEFVFFYIVMPIFMVVVIFYPKIKDGLFLKQHYGYLVAVFGATLFMLILSAREGSGIYHLIPLILIWVPVWGLLFKNISIIQNSSAMDVRQDFTAVSVLFLCLLAAGLFIQPVYYARTMDFTTFKTNDQVAKEIYQDLQNIIKTYPNAEIHMGYGGFYPDTYFRPVLNFRSNIQPTIDAAALMHWSKVVPFPQKALDDLKECRVQVYLIPQEGEPFVMDNFFSTGRQLFPEEFKKEFHSSYVLEAKSRFYDIWTCRKN